MKKQVEITVLGQKFVVRSDSDEAYVARVGSFVDERMNEIMKNTRSVASINVAILAAMNIADEYFKFKDKFEGQKGEVEKKIQEMIELIDLQL